MGKQAPAPPDFAGIRLKPPALDLLEAQGDGVHFLQAALQKKLFADALDFVPQWFPTREAVWWGCLCAWQVLRGTASAESAAALKAAATWVFEPNETNRRAAEAAGTATVLDDPAGILALAAFYSGGSMTAPDQPAVEPPPDLAAQTIGNALTVLCARLRPDEKDRCLESFVQLALDISTGKLPWQPPAPARR